MSRRSVSSNPEAQERLRGREKDRARRYYDALREVYGSPSGRIVLRRILSSIVDPSFTGSSETFYREGRRSVSLDLLRDLTLIDRQSYARLIAEDAQDASEEQVHQKDAEIRANEEDND